MRTVELIATSPDGWALACSGSECWLLRPPYREADRCRLTQAQVSRALADEDFSGDGRKFGGWGDLVRTLESQRIASATPEQRAEARTAAQQLLERATARQAEVHLAKIEQGFDLWLPARVQVALGALLRSAEVAAEPELVHRIGALLQRINEFRPKMHGADAVHTDWPVRDEQALAATTSAIQQRGGVLRPVAA